MASRIPRVTRRPLPLLHPAGVALGAVLAAVGVALAEWLFGPVLLRSLAPPEAQVLAAVHDRLVQEYAKPCDPRGLMHRGIEAMLGSLQDPYTYFIGPDGLEELEEESSGQFEGIGVVLDAVSAHVRWPVPGGPAEKAGILPGDLVVAVDGRDVRGLGVEEVRRRIRGPAGTRVRLALERVQAGRVEVEVARGAVPTGTVGKVEMLDPALGIGFVHIRSFAATTPDELDAALASLRRRGLRGLVLDLRFNVGGLLPATVEVASRFLDGGVVCTLLSRGHVADVRLAARGRARAADLPLAVLLNGLSASGSEILAGALRDHGAAVLVGERSYGKGVYQQVHPYLDQGFAFKLTAGYYVTPSGRILEGHLEPEQAGGLEPDLEVRLDEAVQKSVHEWLRFEEPPERYREAVHRLFPAVAEIRQPADPVREAAVRHLRQVLLGT